MVYAKVYKNPRCPRRHNKQEIKKKYCHIVHSLLQYPILHRTLTIYLYVTEHINTVTEWKACYDIPILHRTLTIYPYITEHINTIIDWIACNNIPILYRNLRICPYVTEHIITVTELIACENIPILHRTLTGVQIFILIWNWWFYIQLILYQLNYIIWSIFLTIFFSLYILSFFSMF